MPSSKRTPWGLLAVVAATGIALMVGCGRRSEQTTGKAPPIPKAGPLAKPRSLSQVGLPVELTQKVIPQDNPQTPEKVALGQKLFFDGRLSADDTVACATCHDPARAFTDGRPVSIGIHGRVGQRNAPTILNALYNKTQFWDGRANTLEEQASFPIINSFEMGQPTLDAAVSKLAGIEEYKQAFQKVFGRPLNSPDLLRAIAPTSELSYRSIPRSITSSPELRMPLTNLPSAAGNCSTRRPAAINAMP